MAEVSSAPAAQADVSAPVPAPWQRVVAASGATYYWNTETDETSFTLPVAAPAGTDSAASRPAASGSGAKKSPWERVVAANGTVYFWNTETDETSLNPPPDEDEAAATPAPPAAAGDSVTPVATLPPGWEEVRSDAGAVYYWNTETNETTFTRPRASSVPDDKSRKAESTSTGSQAPAKDAPIVVASMTAAAAAAAASAPSAAISDLAVPEPWERVVDATGKVYYWNTKTNETTFQFPGRQASKESVVTEDALPDDADGGRRPGLSISSVASSRPDRATSTGSTGSAGHDWTPIAPPKPKPIAAADAMTDDWESREELAEYLSYFEDIDVTRKGYLDVAAMRLFNTAQSLGLSEPEIRALIDDKDLDGDGRVTTREFIVSAEKRVPWDRPHLYEILFDRYASDPAAGANPVEVRKCLDTLQMQYTDDMLRVWMRHPTSTLAVGVGRRLPKSGFLAIFFPPASA